MNEICHSTEFNTELLQVRIKVTVNILRSMITTIDFSHCGTIYSFTISRWSGKGYGRFIEYFFDHTSRDPEIFGTFERTDDGNVILDQTPMKKYATITQACKDIMTTINDIAMTHKRSVMDYAIWFRENKKQEDNYVNLITRQACNCIVHGNFLNPSVIWEVVEFKG